MFASLPYVGTEYGILGQFVMSTFRVVEHGKSLSFLRTKMPLTCSLALNKVRARFKYYFRKLNTTRKFPNIARTTTEKFKCTNTYHDFQAASHRIS